MKWKVLKVTLIILAILVAIVVAFALAISPVAKNYIEKHSKELIGRKVLMKDLHLNIFTGTLRLDAIRMYEANDKDVFASIDTFYMDLALLKLVGSQVDVTELKVVGPYAVIQQNGELFNFDDLIPKEDSTEVEEPSSFPKSIIIHNIYVNKGKLVYTDMQLKNTIQMNDLGVAIPELSFDDGNTNAGIHLKIGDKATLSSKLAMDMKTNEYKLNLKVDGLPINIIYPYLKESFNIGTLEGLLNGDLQIMGNMNHVMDFKVNGSADASGFNMTNSLGEPIASAQSASVKIDTIFFKTSTYLFDYVHATGANLAFILHPKTDNFTALFKEGEGGAAADSTASASASASEPMTVKIKDLHIDNSQVTYTDNTLRTPFSLPMTNVDFQSANFDMNGTNEFKAKASFPEGGNVHFSWKGNMNNLANQQIMINLQNLSLRLFSPYCLDYTAYDITNGNMNFVSKNDIRNNNIISSNILDVYKMNVGKKHKELKVEYNVPLKIALYVLKDKDDKIKFDIPVKGNVNDPEFSYKKIVFKTLVNLMVKVAVSPVRFLANSLGMNSDKMESIALETLQRSFSAEQYSQLNDLASILKQKPDMQLAMTQYVDYQDALQEYAIYRTKTSYLDSMQTAPNNVPLSYEEVMSVKDNDQNFRAYLDTLVVSAGKVSLDAPLQAKVNSLYAPDSIQAALNSLLEHRNIQLKEYMVNTCQIPLKNLIIRTAAADTLNSYKEKASYKIEMTLPGSDSVGEAAK